MARSRIALVLGAALVAALLFSPSALAQTAKVKYGKVSGCPVIVGQAPSDSTRLNGEPDATTHVHQFWGNPLPVGNNTVAYSDAVAHPLPCVTEPNDATGNWVPVLCYDSSCKETVAVLHTTDYYRCPAAQAGGCPGVLELPADTRLISGNYNWTCGQNSTQSAPVQSIPSCLKTGKPGLTLTLHITFPDCGTDSLNDHSITGDINDNSQFTFAKKVGGKAVCPAAFPVKFTQVKFAVEFNVRVGADYSQLILTSDIQEGTLHGTSAHGDYSQWWLPNPATPGETFLQDFMNRCVTPVNQGSNCG